MRFTDWCRIRVTPTSDPGAASALIPQARALLGQMLNGLQLAQQRTGLLRRTLPGGETIEVSFDGTTPVITIDVPPADLVGEDVGSHNLWLPRGLLVYPAWSDAPGGIGLPVIKDPASGPYSTANLAPGMSRSRWTAGGPCGEVLLSPDKKAGYQTNPVDIAVPLLFDASKGPVFRWAGKGMFDAREPTGAWSAYRIELVAPVANYSDESVANCLALFEAVNAARSDAGRHPLNLPPRGLYQPGKVTVSIMQAAGSVDASAQAYPANYRTVDDRLTKEGFSAVLMGAVFASFDRGANTEDRELRVLGGSPAELVTGWLADPVASESVLLDTGTSGFLSVGFRGGYWCADVQQRNAWLHAGAGCWTPPNSDLPPVSWHSFPSMNLAWETYPVQFDPSHYDTAPLLKVTDFTNDAGDCWLNYPRAASPTLSQLDPGLSRHVFMRGRAIAIAPRGGLVWAACVVAVGTIDRLVVLVHHPEDQPVDTLAEGCTRYLRVWWCDVPRRASLRCDPQLTIAGEDSADPWSWRGGQKLDLGVLPPPTAGFTASAGVNSLKYASVWRFSPDGTRAACLRDYATVMDHGRLSPYYGSLYPRFAGTMTVEAMNPRTVELAFTHTAQGVDASLLVHDYLAGQKAPQRSVPAPLDTADRPPYQLFELGCFPIAVDYDAAGNLVYALSAHIASAQQVPCREANGTATSRAFDYTYVGIGSAATQYASDLAHRVLAGALLQGRDVDRIATAAVVVDVVTASFCLQSIRPRWRAAQDGNGDLQGTATGAPCFPFTTDPCFGVLLTEGGAPINERWFSCPDGVVPSFADPCSTSADPNAYAIDLPLAASRMVQAYRAERFGQRVLCYQHSPLPQAALVIDTPPGVSGCGCTVTLDDSFYGARLLGYDEWNPRGGFALSSIPTGGGDWLIYAKSI